jgi:hypothetical protein
MMPRTAARRWLPASLPGSQAGPVSWAGASKGGEGGDEMASPREGSGCAGQPRVGDASAGRRLICLEPRRCKHRSRGGGWSRAPSSRYHRGCPRAATRRSQAPASRRWRGGSLGVVVGVIEVSDPDRR